MYIFTLHMFPILSGAGCHSDQAEATSESVENQDQLNKEALSVSPAWLA